MIYYFVNVVTSDDDEMYIYFASSTSEVVLDFIYTGSITPTLPFPLKS